MNDWDCWTFIGDREIFSNDVSYVQPCFRIFSLQSIFFISTSQHSMRAKMTSYLEWPSQKAGWNVCADKKRNSKFFFFVFARFVVCCSLRETFEMARFSSWSRVIYSAKKIRSRWGWKKPTHEKKKKKRAHGTLRCGQRSTLKFFFRVEHHALHLFPIQRTAPRHGAVRRSLSQKFMYSRHKSIDFMWKKDLSMLVLPSLCQTSPCPFIIHFLRLEH